MHREIGMFLGKWIEYLGIAGRGLLLSLIGLFMIGVGTLIPMGLKWLLH